MSVKRKLKDLENTEEDSIGAQPPSYTDDENEDSGPEDRDVEMEGAEQHVDPKYAVFYKRFQAAAKKIPLSQLQNQETTSQPVDEDELMMSALKQKESEIVPTDLVPLPVPEISSQLNAETESATTVVKPRISSVPKWMTEPIHFASDASIPFADIPGLSAKLKANLEEQGLTSAFAVQAAVLPEMLRNVSSIAPDPRHDMLVNAATGSGKTLAYAIPIIQALSTRVVPRIRAIVVVPTKPLVQQVTAVITRLAKGTDLSVAALKADRSFASEKRLVQTMSPDIIVTAPGRLVDHIRSQTPGFELSALQYLVIDEADRLLNQSFQEWVDVLLAAIDSQRKNPGPRYDHWHRPVQKLIFSATLTRDPEKLASLQINDPKIFVIGAASADVPNTDRLEFTVPSTLTEKLIAIRSVQLKPLRLLQILLSNKPTPITKSVIIFVNSNESAARLARLLTLLDEQVFHNGLEISACSGEMDSSRRRKILASFSAGNINMLVCTDLIARGVDLAGVHDVVNYELPSGRREYVHRVGRTARAGKEGTAWTLACDSAEHRFFWNGISAKIFRENNKEVEKISADSIIEPEGTREYYRQDDGYKAALKIFEEELTTKK